MPARGSEAAQEGRASEHHLALAERGVASEVRGRDEKAPTEELEGPFRELMELEGVGVLYWEAWEDRVRGCWVPSPSPLVHLWVS